MDDGGLPKSVHITHAAAHIQAKPGDAGGQLRRQKQGRSGNVIGHAGAAQGHLDVGNALKHGVTGFARFRQLIPEYGDDGVRLHAVDANPEFGQQPSAIRRRPCPCVFIRGRSGLERAVGRADDNFAALLLLHLGHHSKAAVVHAPLVDCRGLFQHLLLRQIGVAVKSFSGKCRQDINAAKLLDGLCDNGLHIPLLGNIHFLRKPGHAAGRRNLIYNLLRCDGVEICNHNLCALLGIQLCRRFSHTRRAAGHNHNLILQPIRHNLCIPFQNCSWHKAFFHNPTGFTVFPAAGTACPSRPAPAPERSRRARTRRSRLQTQRENENRYLEKMENGRPQGGRKIEAQGSGFDLKKDAQENACTLTL